VRLPNDNTPRDYCDQIITEDLNLVITELLQTISKFQERAKAKDPEKIRVWRRYVCGLREVSRAIRSKRIKMIIISPNIERCSAIGGLDNAIKELMVNARRNDVPVLFALNRTRLARALGKRLRQSVVGIINPDGILPVFRKAIDLAGICRAEYRKINTITPPQQITTPKQITIPQLTNTTPEQTS